MLSTLAATLHFVRSRNRSSLLQRAARQWRFMNSDVLPETFLVDLFPETAGKEFSVTTDVRHHFELPYGERMVLAAIVSALRPRRVFEFGTYTGATTALIARACPDDSIVHTLDLPAEELRGSAVSDAQIGARFAGQAEFKGRIQQHRINSRTLDAGPFENQFDLVYIDASHEYGDVLHDSRLGLRMLAPKGVMIWDDYQVSALPVAEAVDVLAKEIPIQRIYNTRLAVHRRQ
jgi:predicted O-methyltransferase YrrM